MCKYLILIRHREINLCKKKKIKYSHADIALLAPESVALGTPPKLNARTGKERLTVPTLSVPRIWFMLNI